ncbi:MFS transporter [Candidatus Microgenomates bacterium]|nr:MFS transporter [Candidatus Microgenomates bacterium]
MRKILLLSDALFLLSGGLLGPIYALFVGKIGGDLLDASGAFAFFMLAAGAAVFLLAFWEDKIKYPKVFIIAGYGVSMIGTAGYLFVDSPRSLFIVQIVLGLAVALKDPAYDALFSLAGKRHLALAWGEWEAVDYLTLGLSAFAGGLIAQFLGFQILLWCMFLLSVFAFLSSILLLKTPKISDGKI